jgi:hypothetical protein
MRGPRRNTVDVDRDTPDDRRARRHRKQARESPFTALDARSLPEVGAPRVAAGVAIAPTVARELLGRTPGRRRADEGAQTLPSVPTALAMNKLRPISASPPEGAPPCTVPVLSARYRN